MGVYRARSLRALAGSLLFGGIALALAMPAQAVPRSRTPRRQCDSAVARAAQQEDTTRHKCHADDSSDQPLLVFPERES
jgi:hypothetical protein